MIRIAALSLCLLPFTAQAEVRVDIDAATAKAAIGSTELDDLSVNDTAHIYSSFCIQDGRLYVPGWTIPADLVSSSYAQTGIISKIQIIPGKKLKLRFVDGAQAQAIAKGNASAAAVLSAENYDKEVRLAISGIFRGGLFGTLSCEEEQRQNPVREISLFEVESINGYNLLSDLLKSVSKK